jgi:hypothetical protein
MNTDTSKPDDIELLECEVCLKEIPPGSDEYHETDDYVQHYCGIECYQLWKAGKIPGS